jgi:hypothetical protein
MLITRMCIFNLQGTIESLSWKVDMAQFAPAMMHHSHYSALISGTGPVVPTMARGAIQYTSHLLRHVVGCKFSRLGSAAPVPWDS